AKSPVVPTAIPPSPRPRPRPRPSARRAIPPAPTRPIPTAIGSEGVQGHRVVTSGCPCPSCWRCARAGGSTMHARERALAVILDAHRRAASAEVAAPSPFHGWPGLVWVEQHVRHATGTPIPELLALARRGRAGRQRPVPLPAELHATFLYGVRGRRWAERALDGRSTDDLGPPEVALGFDTFANDGPVYFAWLVRRTDEDRTWSALLAHERTRFERCRR